jgi:uncharacterized SAM-binding protein YcdF (DUF218 family)
MFYKILHFFEPLLRPVAFVWLLCVVGLGILIWKKQKLGSVILGVITLTLWVLGTNVPKKFFNGLEKPYIGLDLNQLPRGDAMILLGGGHVPSRYDYSGFNLNDAGDRITTAILLAKKTKVPVLVLGGAPYRNGGEKKNMADLLVDWAQEQLPDTEIVVMGITANTYEEAIEVRDMANERGWRDIIVVTSAYHMKRTEGCFNKVGVPIIPAPCDFQTRGDDPSGWNPFPKERGFDYASRYVHEKVGWLVYRMKGWVTTERPPPLPPKAPEEPELPVHPETSVPPETPSTPPSPKGPSAEPGKSPPSQVP